MLPHHNMGANRCACVIVKVSAVGTGDSSETQNLVKPGKATTTTTTRACGREGWTPANAVESMHVDAAEGLQGLKPVDSFAYVLDELLQRRKKRGHKP